VFLCSIMTFPRSFVAAKLVCLGIFLYVHVVDPARERHFRVQPRILAFYSFVAIGGLVWALIGLSGRGDPGGVIANLRLYVAWSLAYLLIMTMLRNGNGLGYLHTSIVLSGLLIAAINFVGIYDQYAGLGLLSERTREELRLAIGFHEGYVHVTSHNIGSLLFITPYLIAVQFLDNTRKLNDKLTKVSFIACMLISALSGRRALWMCMVLTPLVIAVVALASSSYRELKPYARRLILVMTCGLAFAAVMLLFSAINPGETGVAVLDHMGEAFSAEDERSIQSGYLVSSFMDQPIAGSGFGAYAGYLRNDDMPWLYELTYSQLLFNFGLIGMLYWAAFTGAFGYFVCRVIREARYHTGQPLCLIVGVCGVLIGTYSNPYLGSFDFLVFLAMVPFVASLRNTFGRVGDRRSDGPVGAYAGGMSS
jgi:hypothetical protein